VSAVFVLVVPFQQNKKYQVTSSVTVNVKAWDNINCSVSLNGYLVRGSQTTFVCPSDNANLEFFLLVVICSSVVIPNPSATLLDSRPVQFSKWMAKWFDMPTTLGLYVWSFLPLPHPDQYFKLNVYIISQQTTHTTCVTSKLYIALI
jgi:hypothetical protein